MNVHLRTRRYKVFCKLRSVLALKKKRKRENIARKHADTHSFFPAALFGKNFDEENTRIHTHPYTHRYMYTRCRIISSFRRCVREGKRKKIVVINVEQRNDGRYKKRKKGNRKRECVYVRVYVRMRLGNECMCVRKYENRIESDKKFPGHRIFITIEEQHRRRENKYEGNLICEILRILSAYS